jgi:hypothetical protein
LLYFVLCILCHTNLMPLSTILTTAFGKLHMFYLC